MGPMVLQKEFSFLRVIGHTGAGVAENSALIADLFLISQDDTAAFTGGFKGRGTRHIRSRDIHTYLLDLKQF